ncbi:hypothetical protein BC834DRAFT_894258 [Gloeopeniophorella convolvens]|nr:hypothetical protein BC834DRAFT_894258 [Gloeopeniophorella convolvens]
MVLSQANTTDLQSLFKNALDNYSRNTGVDLASHSLAHKLKGCSTVEDVNEIFQEQMSFFDDFRASQKTGKIMRALGPVVDITFALVSNGALCESISLAMPPARAVFASIGILLEAVKKVSSGYNTVTSLFKSIKNFLGRLEVYMRKPPTSVLSTAIVYIVAELLSIFALVTKQIKQGRLRALMKALRGKTEVEDALRLLDQLTRDEAVAVGVETWDGVRGLVSEARQWAEYRRAQLLCRYREWLSAPHPSTNHNAACAVRLGGTGKWFLEGSVYREWKAGGSLLWIHGKLGSGKTVLCSSIIEDILRLRATESVSVAYFYCDFGDPTKKSIRGLLCSILVQLCTQSESHTEHLSALYSTHDGGFRQPSDDELVRCLKSMLESPKSGTKYLIIDALDECSDSGLPPPRAKIIDLLKELCSLYRSHGVRVCIFSRPEHDIQSSLEPLEPQVMSLDTAGGHARDIVHYVDSTIASDPEMSGWDTNIKNVVVETLSQKAHGMFRYVSCQLEALRECHPPDVPSALVGFPKGLEETYERALHRISERKWKYAYRLFQRLIRASGPLRVDEAARIFSIDFESRPAPGDPERALLSICSSLVTIASDASGRRVVQFAHFSVGEYLTSAGLALSRNIKTSRYHVGPELSRTTPVHTCVIVVSSQSRMAPGGGSPEYALNNALRSLFPPTTPIDVSQLTAVTTPSHSLDPQCPACYLHIFLPKCVGAFGALQAASANGHLETIRSPTDTAGPLPDDDFNQENEEKTQWRCVSYNGPRGSTASPVEKSANAIGPRGITALLNGCISSDSRPCLDPKYMETHEEMRAVSLGLEERDGVLRMTDTICSSRVART